MNKEIYRATIHDIDDLITLRLDFLRDEHNGLTATEELQIREQVQTYFEKHLPAGDFIVVIAKVDGKIVSTAFMLIIERPANTSIMTGIAGSLHNVFTYPEYRRKGFAKEVITNLIQIAQNMGVSCIDLSATPDGKALYEKLGFTEPSYTAMQLLIK